MEKPTIRFKGYTDDWEQRKLNEIADKVSEKNKNNEFSEPFTNSAEQGIISQKDYFDREIVNNENLNGYYIVRNDDFIYNPRISVTAPVGPINRNRLGRNGVMSPLYTVFRTHDIDNLYLEFYFKTTKWHRFMKLNGDSGARFDRFTISSTQFMEMPIPYPTLEEQQKIGEYFDSLDNLITLHHRKCEETKILKKYMLQKMFPQNGQKVPEIRFKGFTEDWEQRKLGELYQRNTERNENLIGYDKTISVATMSYKDDGNGASESSLSTYKVLRVGDIAFEGHTNKQFRFGRFVVNDIGTGIMSPRFSTLRPLNEMPVNFWKQYIHSESVMRRILVNSTKAGTMMNELVIPEFLNQTIMVPSENEQAVIGQYFTNLDHLITLHQRKCEELKNIKKFMLQNMFV